MNNYALQSKNFDQDFQSGDNQYFQKHLISFCQGYPHSLLFWYVDAAIILCFVYCHGCTFIAYSWYLCTNNDDDNMHIPIILDIQYSKIHA